MAPLYYDGTASSKGFLYALECEYPSLNPSQWIETIYCHLEGEALEWAKNDEQMTKIHFNAYHGFAIVRTVHHLYHLLEDRFATSLSSRVHKALKGIKQERHESIESYYTRVKTLFEHVGGRDKSINQYLDYEHGFSLLEVVNWFVAGLRNTKLRSQMLEEFWIMYRQDRAIDISLQSTCTAAQLKYTIMKSRIRQPSTNEQSLVTCQVNTAIVGNINVESVKEILASGLWMSPHKPLLDIDTVDESPPVLEQIPCDLSEISKAEDITNIETPATPTASKSVKWATTPTSLQKPSFETSTVYESPPVLEEMLCNLSEISTAIVDSSDNESIDEILASGPRKWTTASAEKEVFTLAATYEAFSKSPPATDIEKDTEVVEAPNNSPAQSIVDVETLNQEVFALAAMFDAISKNPPAPYSEDIEISAAVDMSSLEHPTSEYGFATEAFDSVIEIGTFSKSPSIQHIEGPETMEKISDSACTYELPALPAFDLSIDIDFEAYTIDTEAVIQPPVTSPRRKMQLSPFRGLALRNKSFGWSRSVSSVSRRTSSISTCTTITSDVTFDSIETAKTEDTVDTEFCEGEQSSCSLVDVISTTIVDPVVSASVGCVVSEDTNFYGGEQFCSPVDDIVIAIASVVVDTDALTLTVDMVKKKESVWMSLLGLILLLAWPCIEYLAKKPKHKGLPKVKIKKLSEPEHTNRIKKSNHCWDTCQIHIQNRPVLWHSTTVRTLETWAGCACKMVTFSDTSIRINTSGISVVFAYKMAPFSGNMQGSESCKTEDLEPAYDFGISGLQNSHLVACNCDEDKVLLLWILGILRYLFYESSILRRTTWSI